MYLFLTSGGWNNSKTVVPVSVSMAIILYLLSQICYEYLIYFIVCLAMTFYHKIISLLLLLDVVITSH